VLCVGIRIKAEEHHNSIGVRLLLWSNDIFRQKNVIGRLRHFAGILPFRSMNL
jgi:hypothetical protein